VAYIASRRSQLGKQGAKRFEQVADLVRGRLSLAGIAAIGHLGGTHQQLAVPGDYKNRTAVDSLGEQRRIRSAAKRRQNYMGSANAADHRIACFDPGPLANAI